MRATYLTHLIPHYLTSHKNKKKKKKHVFREALKLCYYWNWSRLVSGDDKFFEMQKTNVDEIL
jgi:hypothetical protein